MELLKANELRIGNLCIRTNKITSEMLELELTASCILDISANGKMSSFIYEPIALTEEWLLKIGFNKAESENKFRFKERLIILDKGVFIDFGSRVILENVHQTQNFIFALTGQELKLQTHDPKD